MVTALSQSNMQEAPPQLSLPFFLHLFPVAWPFWRLHLSQQYAAKAGGSGWGSGGCASGGTGRGGAHATSSRVGMQHALATTATTSSISLTGKPLMTRASSY